MDALKNMEHTANKTPDWEWSLQAKALLEKYPKTVCPRCKYGTARATHGLDIGCKHTIHLRMYCKLLSMDVYDNAPDSKIAEIISTCDDFDDSPDD